MSHREEPNPGAGPNSARVRDEEGPLWNYEARFQRHGTITLFVALAMLDGKVIGEWSIIQKLENLLGCYQGKKYCLELLKN